MVDINNNITRAEQLIAQNKEKQARSSEIMRKRAAIAGTPEVNNRMARSVSDERREIMEMQLDAGEFREQGSGFAPTSRGDSPDKIRMIQTQAGVVSHNGRGLYKMGSGSGNVTSTSSGWRGSNDSTRQVPEVYSPLWLNSNLNLPRDRPTINAWSRSFFALNPIVHNAISLHSTYPIAKLNIKSKNPKVEKFFAQMIEEIDLMNMAVLAAQEYWILGEAFIYAELDESAGKWSRLMILNPDYVNVQRNVIAAEPIISLRPDENLRRVVHGNQPSDLQQRKQLDPSIVEHVRKNEDIPLNNFYVHHMARRISPYEIRGTGLVVSCFRALMLWDKLRECYGTEHEVLTQDGWKTIFDIIEINKEDVTPNRLKTVGVDYDENGNVHGVITLKKGVKVAQFNPETEELEFVEPEELHMSRYQGKMLHFSGKKVDALVTPNHKMWVAQRHGNEYGNFEKIPASQIKKQKPYKLQGTVKWTGKDVESVNILDKNIPINEYLKFIGYVISEGCVDTSTVKSTGYQRGRIALSQLTSSDCTEDMKQSIRKFASYFDYTPTEEIKVRGSGFSKDTPKEAWIGTISNKKITNFIHDEIGIDGYCDSRYKKIPRWVLQLSPNRLKVILDALVAGDGNVEKIKDGFSYRYFTISKQLADDVQEIAFKCGYAVNILERQRETCLEFTVTWSDGIRGRNPIIHHNGKGASIEEEDYDGIVWCLGMPSGLFPTRHNGKLTILGNSKYAQADNMVNPLTLVKIGNQDFRPTPIDLEHWRNVFEECHDEETEVLTDHGFMKYDEAIDISSVFEEGTNKLVSNPKNNIKIACFNPDTEELEYHFPIESHVYEHNGEMHHYHNNKIDIKVTPSHNMWIQKKIFTGTGKERVSKWGEWQKTKSKDMIFDCRFRTNLNWVGNDSVQSINVIGKEVPIELYLEYLGYLISEGCLYTDNKSQHTIGITQTIIRKYGQDNSEKYNKISSCMKLMSEFIEKSYSEKIVKREDCGQEVVWDGIFCGKDLFQYFVKEIGTDGEYKSKHKRIPRWVLDLSPRLLNILIDALVLGDGGVNGTYGYCYYTSSKQLADDVYEAVYKVGYAPTMFKRNQVYTIQWSKTNIGEFPLVNKYSTDPRTKEKTELVSSVDYKGKVWCFTVPTGLFVTRRNGKITIQGNCQYDKDFKIFTHDAISVERVGYGQGIYDTSNDVSQLIKEIYIGLMVPSVIMDGSDTTYATGSVALDVLRQRYMQFRQMMTSWLKRKIFAPISQINDFYEYIDGEKTLIVPEVDWNHMSLFDMDSYINNMVNLSQGEGVQKRVSLQTLYRSLGLEYEEEQRKIRYEDIQDAIRTREVAAMQRYNIHELKSLGPGDEIDEVADEPVPGQSPYEPPTSGGGPAGGALSMPGMPPMPGGRPAGAPPPSPIGGTKPGPV